MSKALHPRNKHKNGYSFPQLGKSHPPLNAHLRDNGHGASGIDFSDASAVTALNTALLADSYNIKGWSIPEGALCPPIPGRVDYIHYVADLVAETTSAKTIRMLDVGTGANGIYPLLASSVYGWECVGADISPDSLANVKAILKNNPELQPLCELRLQPDKHVMFSNIIQPDEYFEVTVCNPPFHASADEARASAVRKASGLARNRGDKAANTSLNFGGMENELWCNGGEALFLKKMAKESLLFARQVGWFTSLVSKSDTLKPLKKQLTKLKATDIREIEMVQGKKITRIIAWTFR
ncbi:23S rRNA (adenine(1618)-N(6))-methyltransferase RlmF [uncultured Thalassolituus sp.]|uniref:23S rRNA (adenine(1618)-N(6))-methyltransferase RlmF n=1 Tax=uncultured Thalassolituus sp. TaxID=285273 RepID=UPI002625847B|nr:23S rRNA (adenine(1618)-N(6))-methyltransferase RlmF [uncultured Thalassolituus sp.]